MLNYQLKPFVSWRPDPEAMAIDAFSLDWREQYFYAFPPFSLINRVLHKVEQDQSQGIIIVPMWNTQVWFPRLQIIRNSLTARGISQKTAKFILQSWRQSTHKQYSVYLKKWLVFCSSRGFDPYKALLQHKL